MSDRFSNLYTERAQAALPSAIREICKLAGRGNVRSLAGGWPDPEVFPISELLAVMPEVLTKQGDAALQYGTTEGLAPLRDQIAVRAKAKDGLDINPDQILMLHGSQQGMDLCCRVFVEPGDAVAVGEPTYFGGFGAVRAAGGDCVGVPMDAQGMVVEALPEKIACCEKDGQRMKGVYVIPNFQNPTGATLSLERRRRLVELAERHDFMIFEDDPYGELRFEGEPLPPVAAFDKSGRVVHIRSLSKTFSPGLRLAWLHAEAGVLRRMVIAKQFMDACTNSLGQHLVLAFLKNGWLDAGIARNIAVYRAKRDTMLMALETFMPEGVHYSKPKGGFFVWVTLPGSLKAEVLLARAAQRGVLFVAGRPFFQDNSGSNTLRLSYSQVAEEDIIPAVRILAEAIRDMLGQ
jgi:2-aminoadipate transaminase